MKFGMFMIGESAAMFTAAALIVTLCFGGWSMPGLEWICQIIASDFIDYRLLFIPATIGVFLTKLMLVVWLFIAVRWSIPRFRYDQLMRLGWKRLLPVALAFLVITVAVKEIATIIELQMNPPAKVVEK
jgi:NADH-quinone oxidoreductase subunit H